MDGLWAVGRLSHRYVASCMAMCSRIKGGYSWAPVIQAYLPGFAFAENDASMSTQDTTASRESMPLIDPAQLDASRECCRHTSLQVGRLPAPNVLPDALNMLLKAVIASLQASTVSLSDCANSQWECLQALALFPDACLSQKAS